MCSVSGTHRVDERGANINDSGAPFYDVYETADGRCVAVGAVGAVEDKLWEALLRLLDLRDTRVAGDRWNPATWSEWRMVLRTALARRTQHEWCELAEAAGVCLSPVLDGRGAAPPAQSGARGLHRGGRRRAARTGAAVQSHADCAAAGRGTRPGPHRRRPCRARRRSRPDRGAAVSHRKQLTAQYRGRRDVLPFPRQAGSWYHWSKVHGSNNIMFACRVWGLRGTDVMQGVVFGTHGGTAPEDPRLRTRFDFDEAFGTAINRFCCQAVIGHPITPYGVGHQKRGFLPLRDSMQCLTLAIENPPAAGEYRVVNQFEAVYDLTELAYMVQRVAARLGLRVDVNQWRTPA